MGEAGRHRTVTVNGSHAYVGMGGVDLLGIVDITDPSDLRPVYARSLPGHDTQQLAVGGSYVYAVSNQYGLMMYDASDPNGTRVVQSIPDISPARGASAVAASGDGRYVYTATPGGVRIFEVLPSGPSGATGTAGPSGAAGTADLPAAATTSRHTSADFVAPTPQHAFLSETGVLTLHFNEAVRDVDTSRIFVSETGRKDQIPLSGAATVSVDNHSVSITVTPSQNAQILAVLPAD